MYSMTFNDCTCTNQDVYLVYNEGNDIILGPCLKCFCEYSKLSRASTPELK